MPASELEKKIEESASELDSLLRHVRRQIHRNPELSRREYETTAYLSTILEKEGISVTRWDDCTGLFAEVRGQRARPRIALRCEIDAIGMEDAKEVSYASKNPDAMHACGHDAHAAIVLGVALTCQRVREHLKGTVRFIFQPAEEVVPGGALELIERDAMEGVDAIIGFHSDPFLKIGTVGLKAGPTTASADMFDISIIGKSGHTARPHHSKDTVLCAAKVIDSLHQLVDREIDPREPFVLTIGKVHSGTSPNAIPEKAEIAGTVRTVREETRRRMPDIIERVIRGITDSMGVSYDFKYKLGSPPVVNDPDLIGLVEEMVVRDYGREKVIPVEQSMGGEDFSWYLDHAPGALIRLGVTENGDGPSLHSNIFDIHENAIPFGVNLFSRILVAYLNQHGISDTTHKSTD